MSSPASLARALPIALAGTGLGCLVFWPGFIDNDSAWQLQQARSGEFWDMHPVFFTFLWSGLLHFPQPIGAMFLFQTLLFWCGLAVVSCSVFQRFVPALAASLVFAWLPPIAGILSQVVKDTALCASLVFAFGMLLHASQARSRVAFGLALLALFFGLGLRHNAIAAVLPLAVWAGFVLRDPLLPPRLRARLGSRLATAGVGACLLALLVGLVAAANRAIVNQPTNHPSHQILIWDLVGIAARTQNPALIPDFYSAGQGPFRVEELEQIYHPAGAYWIWYGEPETRRLRHIWTREEFRTLLDHWQRAIRAEPAAYLRHRYEAFAYTLGLASPLAWDPYSLPEDGDPRYRRGPVPRLKRWVARSLAGMGDSVLFRAWLYLVLVAALFALRAWREIPRWDAYAALGWSAILYELAYFFAGIGSEFRFSWWTACAALLMPLLLFGREPDADGIPAKER